MVTPRTYTGYDSSGNRVVTCTAQNANNQINPANVQTALDNVSATLSEQIGIIKTALTSLCEDADYALIVEGTRTSELIELLAESLDSIPGCTDSEFESIYQNAVTNHDILQENNNTSAYNSARNTANVTRVV